MGNLSTKIKTTENVGDKIIETKNRKHVSISKYTISLVITEKHMND